MNSTTSSACLGGSGGVHVRCWTTLSRPGSQIGTQGTSWAASIGGDEAAYSPLSPGDSGPQAENQVNCCCEYCRKDYGRQPFLAPELHNFALQKCNSFHPCKYCLQPAKVIPRHIPLYTADFPFCAADWRQQRVRSVIWHPRSRTEFCKRGISGARSRTFRDTQAKAVFLWGTTGIPALRIQ